MQIDVYIRYRDEARKLAKTRRDRLNFARRFLAGLLDSYLPWSNGSPVKPLHHPLAIKMGQHAAQLDPEMAAYLVGTTYTVMLPEEYRGSYGVFYTPPSLTSRLLDLADRGGVDWSRANVVDPACGGGAFMAPVARRMVEALNHLPADKRLAHIESHLTGYEIDPFSAWVSQVFLEAVLRSEIESAGRGLRRIVTVKDSLLISELEYKQFDLVVGNPPYGKRKLESGQREFWSRSLYGHANLYGLFTDLAVRLAKKDGIIAYVTPTSFLGGQYFQALRGLLGKEAPPIAVDFIAHREGVFADVLQETMLSIYKKSARRRQLSISYLTVQETGNVKVRKNGKCHIPEIPNQPWILPRNANQSSLVKSCSQLPYTLRDLGYTVATGPLVWNRHKSKLHKKKYSGSMPLIWAECVSSAGEFRFKATLRDHSPWFKPSKKDQASIVRESCVLLQRTTSIEQERRLIAAELPQQFIDEHGGAVTVENHLNMVRPIKGSEPLVSAKVIAVLLNSETVDQVFRCINGSTAVSAYELESMPLPSPQKLRRLERLISRNSRKETLDKAIREMYEDVRQSAAA